MELSVAKSLIEGGVDRKPSGQVWADLGAGDGLFTRALAELLPQGSQIIAIDKDEHALKNIARTNNRIQTLIADMNDLPSMPPLDGIVMANSLHYIKNQPGFLLKIKEGFLKKSGVLILVEYNLDKANPWVPFPVSKNRLISLSRESGFEVGIFGKSIPSRLNSSEIYSAVLKPSA